MIPIELSPIVIGLIGMGVLFLLLAMGMPVSFAMAIVGFAGFASLISVKGALVKLAVVPFGTVFSYDFAVIPLFIFMAQICFNAELSKDLYAVAFKWLGPLPGGLAMATIGACAIFAAISASSIATAVTLGLVALPEMRKYKYDLRLATGSIAAGGTMGVLIPPSAGLIIYGIIAEQSIGRLFMAGVIPGVLEAIFYIVTILILCKLNPSLGPKGPKSSFKEKLAILGRGGEVIVLIAFVLVGLFRGWFTPTEAGAAGAFGAIVITLFRRRLTWQVFKQSLLATANTAGMIYALMIGAFLLNYFLAASTIPTELAAITNRLPFPPLGIMASIMFLFLGLGCFIDAMAMIMLTIPIFLPLALRLGFDPIWFGILLVRMTEIAVITPPVGMNVFAIHGIAKDVPMEVIFRGILPFLLADIIHVTLLLFVPQICLFLPGLLM